MSDLPDLPELLAILQRFGVVRAKFVESVTGDSILAEVEMLPVPAADHSISGDEPAFELTSPGQVKFR